MVGSNVGSMTYVRPDWSNKEIDSVVRLRVWWVLIRLELANKSIWQHMKQSSYIANDYEYILRAKVYIMFTVKLEVKDGYAIED